MSVHGGVPVVVVVAVAVAAMRPGIAASARTDYRFAIVMQSRPGQVAKTILAWLIILGMIGFVLWPMLADRNTVGGHDWDQMESHRYLIKKTILRFHQFPFWNPYSCGGHTSWGGVESGTTVVSPWFPFYLAMSLPHAMRVEVFGSALISAVGAWLLAGRFSGSPALRAFVVVAFAVNGRWALQTAVGHTWHLAYAWSPWAIYFYDRAVGTDPTRGRPRGRDIVLVGACLAMMVYAGGIYPLPQTAFVIALYGLLLAARTRSFRPIFVGLASAFIAFGLAAPKLIPVLDVFWDNPRLVDSTESIDLAAFVAILTAHVQDTSSRPANVGQWGWHEYGMYVGWAVAILVIVGCVLGRGARESPLKWVGLVCVVLGFGAFDPHAPWALLHRDFPLFKSQHVPTRWQYLGLLLLLTLTAAVLERILRRSGRVRGWIEVAMLGGVAWLAYDIGTVARQPITHAFAKPMPAVDDSIGPFHTEIHIPPELNIDPDYVPASLSPEMANIGTIDCVTFPALNNFFRDQKGRAPGLGARGRADPAYKGEAFIAEGVGQATIVNWTPNAVTVHVTGAQGGEQVVLNQNWDGGWRAQGSVAINWKDTVAATLRGPEATVVFRYRPRFWYAGLAAFVATIVAIGYGYWLTFKGRRAAPKLAGHAGPWAEAPNRFAPDRDATTS
jgi:hypothetical protein